MKINYPRLILVNFLYILVMEFTFKFFVLDTFDLGILYIPIFSLFLSILFTFLMNFSKHKLINKIISIIFYVSIGFIFISETVYYDFYKTICGISALMYGGQVAAFADAIMDHVIALLPILLVMLLPTIILIILTALNKITNDQFDLKVTFALLISSLFISLTSIEIDFKESVSAKDLFYNTNNLIESTNKFGVLSAVDMDAAKLVMKFEEKVNLVIDLPFTKDETEEYNQTDIDFDKLIESTNDDTIKSMDQYFKGQAPTNKNEMTGIFAGKNVIFITAEGFYPFAVNEKYTPTLYKMANSSFVFDNFYQPIYNCSTSDGEFINNLSLLPGVATCSMSQTSDKYLPYTLGNVLNKYGYKSNAFHGWTYTYYGRDKTHPNMGYTYWGYDRYKKHYQYALQGIKDAWPTSDVDVMNASYDIFANEDHFMTYYMSISGHLQYNFGGNAQARKNKALVQDLDADDAIKAYIACNIEFDKSMEILLNNLERDGKLNNTVIAIVADHYPYGLTFDQIHAYDPNIKESNFDMYRNTFILYNPEVETKHIEKNVSSLDVLPTLLNMLGIEYDSRLLMGSDIFSSADDLVIFNNKSWITSKGRYNYLKKSFESFTDEEVSNDYIDNINKIVDMKFKMSKLIISKNYYKHVMEG